MRHLWARQTLAAAFMIAGLSAGGCRRQQPVIAEVGSQHITVKEFKAFAQRIPPRYQALKETPEGRRRILQQLIQRKALMIALTRAGQAPRATHDFAEENLAIAQFRQHLFSTELAVTDADMRDYYAHHPAEFNRRIHVEASCIFVPSAALAQKALLELKKKRFEAVARDMSTDKSSALHGGRRAFDIAAEPADAFQKILLSLPKGRPSTPIKTRTGYVLVRVDSRKSAPPASLNSVKQQLKPRIQTEKYNQWLQKLLASMPVKINDEVLSDSKF